MAQGALPRSESWTASDEAAIGSSEAAVNAETLHKACVTGDLPAVIRYIRGGGDLEAQSYCGRTALAYACFHRHPDIVRALLVAGAGVENRGGGRSTPLFFAAWGGSRRVVRLLLDYGAIASAKDADGKRAGAYTNDPAIVQLLADASDGKIGPSASANRLAQLLHARKRTDIFALVMAASGGTALVVAALLVEQDGGLRLRKEFLPDAVVAAVVDFHGSALRALAWLCIATCMTAVGFVVLLFLGLSNLREERYWRILRDRDIELLKLARRRYAEEGTSNEGRRQQREAATAIPQ